MPKEAFLQLAPAKRDRIIEAAAETFARLGFEGCDMAQVARRAGVAKGSLYNYFQSKEEMFLFICHDGLERSRRAVYGRIEPDWPVRRQIEHIFRAGAEFALDRPQYPQLYLTLAASGFDHLTHRLAAEAEGPTAKFLKDMLRRGVDRGELAAGLDIDLAAFSINGMYILMVMSLVSRYFQARRDQYCGGEGENGPRERERLVSGLINNVIQMLGAQ